MLSPVVIRSWLLYPRWGVLEHDEEPGKALLHLNTKEIFHMQFYMLFQVISVMSKGC